MADLASGEARILKQQAERSIRIALLAHNARRTHKLVAQNADGIAVHGSTEVVRQVERILNADQVSIFAHARCPLLAHLRDGVTRTHRRHVAAVVMAICPVVEEAGEKIRQALGVRPAKPGEILRLVVVRAKVPVDLRAECRLEDVLVLKAGKDRRMARLQEEDAHDDVAVRTQRSVVGGVHLTLACPMLHAEGEQG
eukprot:CAMPEP_0206124920 /NCGR_PEP_ID=MMETSP1472-20131121/14897_1 /ASSEMBLY_ACC=CAM_ASM_001108 /TAXON_ID=41880 /ORGANISM="Pycnococcus provasolii, Strain RCC251" /LENGTH=196 /DNA_ID=CAMNT_0053515773 /DNA_START=208 /DNA_END=799 /DNA_ORIENTATION=+